MTNSEAIDYMLDYMRKMHDINPVVSRELMILNKPHVDRFIAEVEAEAHQPKLNKKKN